MFGCNSDGSIEIPLSYFKGLHFYPPALPLGTIVLINNNYHHNCIHLGKIGDDDIIKNDNVEDLELFVQYLLMELKRKFVLKLDSHSVCDYSPNINNVTQYIENGRDDVKIIFINIPIFFFPDIEKDEPLHKRVLRVVSNTHKITQLVEKYISSKFKSSQ